LAYCSNCGNQLREEAKFCDKCGGSVDKGTGSSLASNDYNIHAEDMVRSTKIYVSQQRLYMVLGAIFVGLFLLIIAAVAPPMPNINDPWGPANDYTFNTIAALMGLGSIVFGIVFYLLGSESQEKY